jgi:hypothetical protein
MAGFFCAVPDLRVAPDVKISGVEMRVAGASLLDEM